MLRETITRRVLPRAFFTVKKESLWRVSTAPDASAVSASVRKIEDWRKDVICDGEQPAGRKARAVQQQREERANAKMVNQPFAGEEPWRVTVNAAA